MLNKDTANNIIAEVRDALKDWKNLAHQIGIPKREINLFSERWNALLNN